MSAIFDKVRADVIIRDNKKCVLCGRAAQDVHEILPRSRFGKLNKESCFIESNMICLCRDCHSMAHTVSIRIKLLKLMQEIYKYTYEEEIYQKYLTEAQI